MLSIYLCDDNKIILRKYQSLINELVEKWGIEAHITTCENGEQLVFALSEDQAEADIIYLDIIMKEMNGISTAIKLRELGCKAEIIYLTSKEEYIFDSLDVKPFQYLLKDSCSNQKFEEIFLKVVNSINLLDKDSFLCSYKNVSKKVWIHEIRYFEIKKRIVTVFYGNEKFDFYETIQELEEQLANKNLVRIHRSYIINLKYLSVIKHNEVVMTTGEVLPVGRTYLQGLRSAFFEFMKKV